MGRKQNNLRKRPVKNWPQHERRAWLGVSENGVTEMEVWPEDRSGSQLTMVS